MDDMESFLCDYAWIQLGYGCGINQEDDKLSFIRQGTKAIEVEVNYNNPLTIAALCSVCLRNGVELKLVYNDEQFIV